MRGIRSIVVCLTAALIAGALGVSPASAKKAKRPPKEPPHVRLSAPLGGQAEGIEGKASWEEEAISLHSSDLLFATSAGNTECSAEVPVGVSENTGRLSPSLIGETAGSLPCSGIVGSEPSGLKTEQWSLRFHTSGTVSACLDPPYFGGQECPTFKESAITLDVGSLECRYLHSAGKKKAAMTGSFDPAALGSAEPSTIEITLPAQKFKLEGEQRKSPAFGGCPREGHLSGHFAAQTAQARPVQSRIVDTQQLLENPRDQCALKVLHGRCTVQFTNFNQTETLELREVIVLQGGVPKEENFLRVPTAGECAGAVESAQPTVLSPGESCSVVIEYAMGESSSGFLLLTSTSQPGGAPEKLYGNV